MFSRVLSFLIGIFLIDYWFHTGNVQAFGFEAETMAERIGALLFTGAVTLLIFYLAYRFFTCSFFNGVIFAAGFFASFDIFVVHWLFNLHRLTDGPEAIYFEVALVILGIIMIVFSLGNEKKIKHFPEST
ncbi:DUF2243 domain-containing protein [Salipaludibacillus aurantiacus]|uniref:Predicted membrane protein n=1 Tax=Salipaludibacillus aurantiacus TaxID=1601833 RepID=A0A1H9S940_9BACI|nr:DUF2243 domain-containing protein [Salipaludibacillus aurantiacus]SER81517.1 Predicted membrane protein [Salipaludibacillus aurantiacus]